MYWHCLPTYSQARKAVWNSFTEDGERTLRAVFPKEIVKHPDEFRPQAEMLIELINGSMIQLVGSDSMDNAVGAGPKHITFSEFALCRPGSYDLVRPILRKNGGTAAFISTPRGKNHLWALMEQNKATKGWIVDLQTVFDTNLAYRSSTDPEVMVSPKEMIEEEIASGMMPALVRQEYLCDFTAALVGSVYGDLMEGLEKEGRVQNFAHDGSMVFTFWDLGLNDSTAVWIMEVVDGQVRVIAHYENHGQPLSHYFDQIDKFQKDLHLKFRKHWLPHDAKALTLAARTSCEDQFRERFGSGMVSVGPKLDLLDGLQAGRWLLQQDIKFHPRCGIGIEALKQYHYEYDDKRKTYTNRPEHDWTSHCADAFRYMAITAKHVMRIAEPRPEALQPTLEEAVRGHVLKTSLDELFQLREQELCSLSNRRIA